MANKVIVLDAGHGRYTAGKRTMNGSRGVIPEWVMNDSVCRKIENILKGYNCKVYRTDDTSGETDVPLKTRVNRCNKYNPDIFVSIHHNAGSGTGVEVYYHTQGTAADKKVAGIIAPKLASACDMKNRGAKNAKFAVLTCNPTAVLVEGGFMDTVSDYELITTDRGQQLYANAVAESIIEYLGLKKVATTKPFAFGEYNAYVVTTSDLNIRKERHYDSKLMGTIPKGTKVKVHYILGVGNKEVTPYWGSVYTEFGNGFINLSYTNPVT